MNKDHFTPGVYQQRMGYSLDYIIPWNLRSVNTLNLTILKLFLKLKSINNVDYYMLGKS